MGDGIGEVEGVAVGNHAFVEAADPRTADLKRAGHNTGCPGVGVVGGQGQGARARLDQAAIAADGVGDRHVVAAVEEQAAVVADRAGAQRTAGAAVADGQRTGIDRCGAGVTVVGQQSHGAVAGVGQAAVATDGISHGNIVAAVEDQGPVVGDWEGEIDRARGSTGTDLQCSAVDRRSTGVGVAAAESNISIDHEGLRRGAGIGQGQIVGQDQRAAHATEKIGVVGGRDGTRVALRADGAQADQGQISPTGTEIQVGGAGGGDGHGTRGTGVDAAQECCIQRIAGRRGGAGGDGHAGAAAADGVGRIELHDSGIDRRVAGIGIGATENQRAGSGLGQAGAAVQVGRDDSALGSVGRARIDKGAVLQGPALHGNSAGNRQAVTAQVQRAAADGDRAGGAAQHDARGGAQLQHAGVDRRAGAPGIGRATEGLRAGAVLDQRDIPTTDNVSEKRSRTVVLADV